jgi:hypothetical protein
MMSLNELTRRRRQMQHRIRLALVQRRVTHLGVFVPESADAGEPPAQDGDTVDDPGDLNTLAA